MPNQSSSMHQKAVDTTSVGASWHLEVPNETPDLGATERGEGFINHNIPNIPTTDGTTPSSNEYHEVEDVGNAQVKMSVSFAAAVVEIPSSDSDNEKSITSLPKHTTSRGAVLKGFGKFNTQRFTLTRSPRAQNHNIDEEKLAKRHHQDLLSIAKVRSAESRTVILVPLLLIVGSLLIPFYAIPTVLDDGKVQVKEALLPVALSMISALPATLFLNYCMYIMKYASKSKTQEGDDDESTADLDVDKTRTEAPLGCLKYFACLRPSVTGICFPLAMTFRQASYLLPFNVPEEYIDFFTLLLNQGVAMFMFTGWISFLDSIHRALLDHARRSDSIADICPSNKWKSIMQNFKRSQSSEVDKGYAIPGGHRSAARVLAEIVGIYCNLGKCVGGVLLLLFFLGIDLYSSLVSLGLTVVFAGAVSALHLNEAFKSVLALSQSNAIHVGEIISVGRTGFTPADNPGTHVTGFVEGFTWNHIIIRDFKRKQVFIGHEEFVKLTFHNWSRRPTKHAHFVIPVVPELSGGADRLARLAAFVGKWLTAHPSIDNEAYKKAVIKWTQERGLVLEVIFFPERGQKARVVRSEFIVMILDAAKRFNLCLMPAEVRSSAPWNEDIIALDGLDDLLPSPDLTERAGYKPKNE